MVSSMFTNSVIHGSYSFVAAIAALILLDYPTDINDSMNLVLLTSIIGLGLSYSGFIKLIVLTNISNNMSKQFHLDTKRAEYTYEGRYGKPYVDRLILHLNNLIAFTLIIILVLSRGLGNAKILWSIFSLPISGIQLFVIPLCVFVLIKIILSYRKDFENQINIFRSLIQFEEYRSEIDFGFEWISPLSTRWGKFKEIMISREKNIKPMEDYLDRNDYRSFDLSFQRLVVNLSKSSGESLVRNFIQEEDILLQDRSSQNWLHTMLLDGENVLQNILNTGFEGISIYQNHVIRSINDLINFVESVKNRIIIFNNAIQYGNFKLMTSNNRGVDIGATFNIKKLDSIKSSIIIKQQDHKIDAERNFFTTLIKMMILLLEPIDRDGYCIFNVTIHDDLMEIREIEIKREKKILYSIEIKKLLHWMYSDDYQINGYNLLPADDYTSIANVIIFLQDHRPNEYREIYGNMKSYAKIIGENEFKYYLKAQKEKRKEIEMTINEFTLNLSNSIFEINQRLTILRAKVTNYFGTGIFEK